MTLTHPDQYAKIAQAEIDGPMFPKGPKQMLGFIYAMEFEVARKMSFHAKLIELRGMMDEKVIKHFETSGINLSGLSPVEINGECAGLRQQVEELLGETDTRIAVWAKFGKDELDRTDLACESLVWGLREILMNRSNSRGSSRQIGREYGKDLVKSVTCSDALYEKKYKVMKISSRHHVSQPTVSRDSIEAKRYIMAILSRAYKEIEKKFSDGVVLCLTT